MNKADLIIDPTLREDSNVRPSLYVVDVNGRRALMTVLDTYVEYNPDKVEMVDTTVNDIVSSGFPDPHSVTLGVMEKRSWTPRSAHIRSLHYVPTTSIICEYDLAYIESEKG